MNTIVTCAVIFAFVFGGALLGILLNSILPKHHLSSESRDIIKLGMGLVGTMAALILGLLTASAKSSFDAQNSGLVQISANVIILDRILSHYGPETEGARTILRHIIGNELNKGWSMDRPHAAGMKPMEERVEGLFNNIMELAPKNETQTYLKSQAQSLAMSMAQARWLMFEQGVNKISMPFLIVLVFWLTVIFMSFGLFAPPNLTIVITLLVCALSVSAAIFLIMELDQPFQGIIHVNTAPLQNAYDEISLQPH